MVAVQQYTLNNQPMFNHVNIRSAFYVQTSIQQSAKSDFSRDTQDFVTAGQSTATVNTYLLNYRYDNLLIKL